MKSATRIALLAIAIAFTLKACDKPSYPENSILGTWRCMEVESHRSYNVSIDFDGSDTSMIKIYNFYNLGFQEETYATVSDTLIELMSFNFSGTGHIERDFSAIYWRFSYLGSSTSQIEAAFVRF